MIVRAAVCPGAPLLVPGLAPVLCASVPELVERCRIAVASLAGVDRIVLITSGPGLRDRGAAAGDSVLHPPGTPLSSAILTDSRLDPTFLGRLPGPASRLADTPPGVGVVVGAAVLAAAGIDLPTTALELRGGPGDLQLVRDAIGDSDDWVGLLVLAEGSGSRGPTSPGGGHPGAPALDAALAAALAAGDPAALAAAVYDGESAAAALLWTSGPCFGALARLGLNQPPERAELLFDDAPFGVGYLVATWAWSALPANRDVTAAAGSAPR